MNHWVITHLNYFFEHYGYWTVFFGILLENAGIPLPGETILIVASVLARTKHELSIADVAVIAVLAAITGDNLGFALGRYGGRPLLDRYRHVFHIEKETVRKAESLFTRRGGMAVFFARFITGLRVVAGPMAGALRMHWYSFLLFNALGAVGWVGVITTLAYFLGPSLEPVLRHLSWAFGVAVVLLTLYSWLKRRRSGNRSHREISSVSSKGIH
jgi:membrane-associated protein